MAGPLNTWPALRTSDTTCDIRMLAKGVSFYLCRYEDNKRRFSTVYEAITIEHKAVNGLFYVILEILGTVVNLKDRCVDFASFLNYCGLDANSQGHRQP